MATVGAAALSGCLPRGTPSLPPGELLGMNFARGHRLRDEAPGTPTATQRTRVLIVGAGISGLSAAWWLRRNGCDDFVLLEMDDVPGGNSRSGQSPIVAYPWGAHYLPLPGMESVLVRELLSELGVLQGSPDVVRPVYDESFLCGTPQERVYRNGLWEDGLLPQRGLGQDDRRQQREFHQRMGELKRTRGRDGRRVFAIPMELSSRDASWRALDRLSFRQWLLDNGFSAPTLHWLANYACRDDYGTDYAQTSAWAGLHYFACRDGEAANASSDTVLTAPEGNAWLVRGMVAGLGERLICGASVARVVEDKHALTVDVRLAGGTVRYEAERLIWAAPLFVLPHVWMSMPQALKEAVSTQEYAPWLTANLHLSAWPEERHGAPPAWDNVFYDSQGLGYVAATHQLLRRHVAATVFTYYRALHDVPAAEGRRLLMETPREAWAEGILAELETVHPDIRQLTTRLDVFRNGHAMRRPVVGSLFDGRRESLVSFRHPRIALAHADLSGFSLFEEAQYRGVEAARRALLEIGLRSRKGH